MIARSGLCSLLKRWLGFALFCLFFAVSLGHAHTSAISLSEEERAWIAAHRQQEFTVGFDPFAGMDFFELRGRQAGFLPALLADMQAQLGLRFPPLK